MPCAFTKSWWKAPWTQLLHSACKIAPCGGAQSCHRLESSWPPRKKLQQFWPVTTRLLNYLIVYVVVSKLTTHTIAENSSYQIYLSTCAFFLLLFILQTQILSNDKSEASPLIFSKGFSCIIDLESGVIICIPVISRIFSTKFMQNPTLAFYMPIYGSAHGIST